jgi:hypothetical protein
MQFAKLKKIKKMWKNYFLIATQFATNVQTKSLTFFLKK